MAKRPPSKPLNGDFSRDIRSLKRLVATLLLVGVGGTGSKFTYDAVFAPQEGAAEVTAIDSLRVEMQTQHAERSKAIAEFTTRIDNTTSKLWEKTTTLDSRIDANALAISSLIQSQENTNKVVDKLAETVEKSNDKHEDRIRELEMKGKP